MAEYITQEKFGRVEQDKAEPCLALDSLSLAGSVLSLNNSLLIHGISRELFMDCSAISVFPQKVFYFLFSTASIGSKWNRGQACR